MVENADVDDAETRRLQAMVGKTFRKAKRWYLGYLGCQLAVLIFALLCVVVAVDPRLIALVALMGVLATESVRWRSEFWKSQGELAKRRWEFVDGFGQAIRDGFIADWLACRPTGFLNDVTAEEIRGSAFDSTAPPGPRRVIENVIESAWWTKHESRLMAWYLGAVLALLFAAILLILSISIGALGSDASAMERARNVGAMICAVLAFVFSINVVRLLVAFIALFCSTKSLLARGCTDFSRDNVGEREALLLLFDYQTARSDAPLLPTFIWKLHGKHLRQEWHRFRDHVCR
jgi:hypothetical protein